MSARCRCTAREFYALGFSAHLGPFVVDLFKHRRYRPAPSRSRISLWNITVLLARLPAFSRLSAILLLFSA